MSNKFIFLIVLLPVAFFIGVNSVNCMDSNTNTTCTDNYCYYVNFTMLYVNGTTEKSTAFYGCKPDYTITLDGANYMFPINHCQHFPTNVTSLGSSTVYGNFCNTRDNCTFNGNDLACAGVRSTPILALGMIIFIFIVKHFV